MFCPTSRETSRVNRIVQSVLSVKFFSIKSNALLIRLTNLMLYTTKAITRIGTKIYFNTRNRLKKMLW